MVYVYMVNKYWYLVSYITLHTPHYICRRVPRRGGAYDGRHLPRGGEHHRLRPRRVAHTPGGTVYIHIVPISSINIILIHNTNNV